MFNPATASAKIKEEFIDYVSTSFSLSDRDYEKLFRESLNKNGVISKGPMIDIKDIFNVSKTINYWESVKINIENYVKYRVKRYYDNATKLNDLCIDKFLKKEIAKVENEHKLNLRSIELLKLNYDSRYEIEVQKIFENTLNHIIA